LEGGLPIILKVLEKYAYRDITNPESIRDSALVAIAHLAKDPVIASEMVDKCEAYKLLGRFLDPSRKWGENTVCWTIESLHYLTFSEQHLKALVRNKVFSKLWELLLRTQNNQIIKRLLSILIRIFCFMKDSKESFYWTAFTEVGVAVDKYNTCCYFSFFVA